MFVPLAVKTTLIAFAVEMGNFFWSLKCWLFSGSRATNQLNQVLVVDSLKEKKKISILNYPFQKAVKHS